MYVPHRHRFALGRSGADRAMSDMTALNDDLLEIPSMAVLRRPLTKEEARKWGGRRDTARRNALAALAQLARSDDKLAEKLAQLLLYRRIYDAMATRLLEPRHGPVAAFDASIREAEKSFSQVLR